MSTTKTNRLIQPSLFFDGRCEEAVEADRAFAGLADGGPVPMPLTQTFCSRRFGMVGDRSGVTWMVIVTA